MCWQNTKLWLIPGALLTLSGCANLPTAQQAFEDGDYNTAEQHWQELAQRGFPRALMGMGRLIAMGEVEGKPPELALQYFLDAYEKDQQHAAFWIGRYYYTRELPTEEDDELAYKWFQKAVQSGSIGARLSLADMQLAGRGTQQDSEAAIAVYQELSAQGIASASRRLARLHENGEHVRRDWGQSMAYYRLAVQQGELRSEMDIARHYARGLGVEVDITRARSLYLPHAERGDARAAFELARLFEQAAEIQGMLEQAVRWYQVAAAQSHIRAQLRIANMMLRGYGLPQNITEGRSRLLALSTKGIAEASFHMGRHYERAVGDFYKARYYYRLAIDQGYTQAELALAQLYEKGFGGEQNLQQAIFLYHKHAIDGNNDAAFALGRIYQQQSKLKEAEKWYQQAAENNIAQAQFALARLLVEQDKHPDRAAYWLHKAAASQYAPALLYLGKQTFYGASGAHDQIEGLTLVLMAARLRTAGAVRTTLELISLMATVADIDQANKQSRHRIITTIPEPLSLAE